MSTTPDLPAVPRGIRRGRRPRLLDLPPGSYERIIEYIRVGAFDHQAAAALGVTPNTFASWLRQGERARSGIFYTFFMDVMRARAEARVLAEAQVKRDNPLAWLRHGPGRTRDGLPGWTEDESTLHLQGMLAHHVQGSVTVAPLTENDMLSTLRVLEELGFITVHQSAQSFLQALPPPFFQKMGSHETMGVPHNHKA